MQAMINAAKTPEYLPGIIYRPEITPKDNGRTIRRNGISLWSTVCSLWDCI